MHTLPCLFVCPCLLLSFFLLISHVYIRFGVWCHWWFHYPGLLLHTELMVSLFIRCTMRCEIWAQLSCLGSSVGRALCLQCRVSWFESHLRQLIFSRKSDCLGCAVLLCIVCLFVCLPLLASFFLLISHLKTCTCSLYDSVISYVTCTCTCIH